MSFTEEEAEIAKSRQTEGIWGGGGNLKYPIGDRMNVLEGKPEVSQRGQATFLRANLR